MDKKKVLQEHARLESLLSKAEVPKQKRAVLEAVIDNMAWQRVKLDETREEMHDASVICEYKNGENQYGERENPIFKAYINLWRAYMVGLEKFSSYLPKDLQDEITTNNLSILDQVKNMKKVK